MSELGGWDGLIGHDQIIGGRSYQQDYYVISPIYEGDGKESLLMVLADGMGGHAGGDVASELAAQAFVDAFEKDSRNTDLTERHKAALIASDDSIRQAVKADPALSGMGTTLVAMYWDGQAASWSSIGDSIMWIGRKTSEGHYRLDRANDDHSLKPLIERRLKEGLITSEEAESMPSHQLRSALVGDGINVDDPEKVQVFAHDPVELYDTEYVILASDGIETLSSEGISEVLDSEPDAASVVEHLISEVERINNPNQDNTTVLVFKLPAANRKIQRSVKVPRSASKMTVRISP